jgi:hypothetical protein
VLLAIFGAGFTCLGSLVIVMAPGDGQTGIVAFPLLCLGGVLGITAILLALSKAVISEARYIIAFIALVATGSVLASFVACPLHESGILMHNLRPRKH